MAIRFETPDTVAPPPVPIYNHVALIPPGSGLLVTAGQVGQALDGSYPETIEDQFRQAVANIVALVTSQGGDAACVARLTCYATEAPSDLAAIEATLRETFGEALPTMTFVYVAGLFAPHVKIEIEGLAAIPPA